MTTQQDISTTLTSWKPSLEQYAVADYDKQAFIKSAMLAITNDWNLQECLKTPQGKDSLFQAMRFAASTGLSLNPQEGKAAIIAYKGKASYQVMKNGLVELAQRSGNVKFITADTVRENDFFDIEKTADGDKYSFKPARKSRGEIDGFFAAVALNDGTCHVKYVTIEETKAIRDQYSSFFKNKPDASPWSHSFEGMGIKTVLKALVRNVSISPEVSAAVGSDDESEAVIQVKDVTPTKGTSSNDVLTKLEDKKMTGADIEKAIVGDETEERMDF